MIGKQPALLPESHKHCILIVDDTPANIAILAEFLEGSGFDVIVAQSGEEGLQRARFARPDLILLDVMMPGIDGLETCRLLKTTEETANTPVIFMTALSDTKDKVDGFEMGGVDYIVKPFQIEEVFVRIKLHLALHTAQKQVQSQNIQLEKEVEVRRQAEQALLQSNDELMKANQKQKELHQQLLQSEKMASIGQLAAGMAHEINNPIAFVTSNLGILQDYTGRLLVMLDVYAQLEAAAVEHPELLQKVQEARDKLELEYLREDLASLLAESLDGVQRVRRIVQDLKDFSHAGDVARQWADLHPGIDSTLNIVWNEIKHKAKVIKDYGKLPEVECVPAQINQVFMNLLVNASHAIESNGTITIRTRHEGPWVMVEIADTGCGIAPDVLNRIFEPFFTTKPIGKGTGLGLSLSYGIIAQHGGRIDVQSEAGNGTAFRVWLPVTIPADGQHDELPGSQPLQKANQ